MQASPRVLIVLLLACCLLCGCATDAQTGGLIAGAATVAGGHSPNNEIEQTSYLGVLDPQEQVPSAVYRIRVRGQASAISFTRFASGWVRAELIDSLNTHVSFADDAGGGISVSQDTGGTQSLAELQAGRRMVLFGPEGFAEAPRNHRLAIVMGSSPERFFEAIDTSLGEVAQAIQERSDSRLHERLFRAIVDVGDERDDLDDIGRDIDAIALEGVSP